MDEMRLNWSRIRKQKWKLQRMLLNMNGVLATCVADGSTSPSSQFPDNDAKSPQCEIDARHTRGLTACTRYMAARDLETVGIVTQNERLEDARSTCNSLRSFRANAWPWHKLSNRSQDADRVNMINKNTYSDGNVEGRDGDAQGIRKATYRRGVYASDGCNSKVLLIQALGERGARSLQ